MTQGRETNSAQRTICARVPRAHVYALADRARAGDRSFSAELRRAIQWYLEHGRR